MPITKWNGPALRSRIEAEMRRRLAAAAILVQNHAKVLIGKEGTAIRSNSITIYRGGKATRKRKGSLIYGANPSVPPNPPHKQTGRLQGSVAWELSGLVARVGTNVRYGKFLEQGWKYSAARPWLRRALMEKAPQLRNLLTAPIGSFTNPIDVTFR